MSAPTRASGSKRTILLVAAAETNTRPLIAALQQAHPLDVIWTAASLEGGRCRLAEGGLDAVILDISLCGVRDSGLGRLAYVAETLPVLILTNPDTEEKALEAIVDGAEGLLLKHPAAYPFAAVLVDEAIARFRARQDALSRTWREAFLSGRRVASQASTLEDEATGLVGAADRPLG